ncbi:proto-oncogene tyrosine-protein kinase receptor Ret [Lutzomyia longipalpis]|uniref:proto-oncogene tyrosine-protein kinase receptor Ret n=1 Tax=Lutzomyia longipalpis TaxID=7200 RepID=UPI002483DB34|nr:proto-oncogene tyrosine-protein kinase receptor Ret [Lutzomyia longipalpis]
MTHFGTHPRSHPAQNILMLLFLSALGVSGTWGCPGLADMKMTVPIGEEMMDLIKHTPLLQLTANGSKYHVHELQEWLTIDVESGEMFLMDAFRKAKPGQSYTVTVDLLPDCVSSTKIEIIPVRITSLEGFCRENGELFCFWDAATYRIPESGKKSGKVEEIGPIASGFLRKICPNVAMKYKMINGSDFLDIRGGILRRISPVDHDTFAPGPKFMPTVECSVTTSPKTTAKIFRKTLTVDILDRNDNPPQRQDDHRITIDIADPHFSKGKQVGSQNVIFLDGDSLQANARMVYEILNDTMEMLKPDCKGYEADHMGLKTSVINCKLIFSRDGILRKSPYCVVLLATDASLGVKENSANTTICISANLSLIHELDGPTAMALSSSVRQEQPKKTMLQQRRNNRRNYVNGQSEIAAKAAQTALENETAKGIVYPHDIYVLRTATNMTRVAQPKNMMDLLKVSSIKFKVTSDPIDAFGITPLGGIIFVRNTTALQRAQETIYYLTISFLKQTQSMVLHVHDDYIGNGTCQTNATHVPSCSEMSTKSTCVKTCGIGVNGGSCQWRSNELQIHLTLFYATCSPNFTYCPDGICDPLEEIGQTGEHYLCPQDCTKHVYGSGKLNDSGLGIYSGVGVCSCDDMGKCSCGAPASSYPKREKKPKVKAKNETEAFSGNIIDLQHTGRVYNVSTNPATWASFQCGASCLSLIIGLPLILFTVVVILILTKCGQDKRCKRKSLPEERIAFSPDIDQNNPDLPLVAMTSPFVFKTDPDSKWEFPRIQLTLDVILGEGEFGKVVKGFATDIDSRPGVTTVAVKMLKTGAHSVELLALLSEFQLLQEVSHPNVIRLLGACTQATDNPLVIIEYAKYGSLRNYLRLSRKIECAGIEFTNGVEPVTVKDILSFAWQICKGMAYLTEIKLVHRDLAARNVLLAEGKVCKISDFGLTRDVYQDDAYLKRSKDRVPVKWMAPESLADHVYTTRSDVWAFGVLAWELITLGASPYPGVPPQNLYHLLKQGYRMEKPKNCSEDIYAIVKSCWADDPLARPAFKTLVSQWERLLGNNAKYIELEQNAISNPLYCSDNDKELPSVELSEDCLDHLWYPPNSIFSDPDNDSNVATTGNSGQTDTTCLTDVHPKGYDTPRPLIETRTVDQRMRYENEVTVPTTTKGYVNQPETLSECEPTHLDPNHYESPIARGKSYVDMTAARVPRISGITNNLDTSNVDKKLSKDISFKFFSLLNDSDGNATTIV